MSILHPAGIDRVVIFSGGMDSFTLLHTARRRTAPKDRLLALSFDYGQRHRRELDKARDVCLNLGIPHTILDIGFLRQLAPGSSLTSDAIATPHGHYAAENMKLTVVPGRNTLMLAAALAYAEGLDDRRPARIYYGAHAGDHHIYPDCRPAFATAMAQTIAHASDHRVRLIVPFLDASKGEVLRAGLDIGLQAADYADTWTCYEGGEHPCGLCGSCTERAEAFAFAGALDPLVANMPVSANEQDG